MNTLYRSIKFQLFSLISNTRGFWPQTNPGGRGSTAGTTQRSLDQSAAAAIAAAVAAAAGTAGVVGSEKDSSGRDEERGPEDGDMNYGGVPHDPRAGAERSQQAGARGPQRNSTYGTGRFMDGLLGKYDIGKVLGEGAYGLVFEARPVGSNRRVALKQISKREVRQEEVMREASALRAIHAAGGHDNIAAVLDLFEDRDFYFFVLELVSGGEMFEHLIKNGPYSEATAAGFMRELAAALQFLHFNQIIHADLKPENLMLSSWDLRESKLKVVDFGSSRPNGTFIDTATAPLGTSVYLPPEALKPRRRVERDGSRGHGAGRDGQASAHHGGGNGAGMGHKRRFVDLRGGAPPRPEGLVVTPALDMWSVGVILFIMLCGAHPFDLSGTSSERDTLKRIRAGKVPLAELGPGVSDSAKDLISRLMTRNPEERLSADQMLRHPWIEGRTAPQQPLQGSDARLARFREMLTEKLEAGVVSMLVGGVMTGGEHGFSDGYQRPADNEGSQGVVEGVDVVKNAYKAFDRRGKGRVNAKDIALFLKEQGTELSEEECKAVSEAIAFTSDRRRPSLRDSPTQEMPPRVNNASTDMDPRHDACITPAYSGAAGPSLPPTYPPPAAGDAAARGQYGGHGGPMDGACPPQGRGFYPAEGVPPPPPPSVPPPLRKGLSSYASYDSYDMPAPAEGDEAGLDMSDFEALLDHLKTREFSMGEFIFREGDRPDDGLYFITKGRVEVLVDCAVKTGRTTKMNHTRVAYMGAGDFFGEGGVVMGQARGASVRAVTPVKVINVDLSSCNRMISGKGQRVSSNLREVALSRALCRAKNVVRAVHSVSRRHLAHGETLFRQGDPGRSLFSVEEGELDVTKTHDGVSRTVARLTPGSCFGEMALMTSQPRSATVVCASRGGCIVNEISGEEFARLLVARSQSFRTDVTRMLRARQFRHGVYKLLMELGSDATFSDEAALRRVFDKADSTKSGHLSLSDLKKALCGVDPQLDESAVADIMAMLDLAGDKMVSFDEFLKMIRWDP